jgi:G:T/U-mismatch repair DNA glycosylase
MKFTTLASFVAVAYTLAVSAAPTAFDYDSEIAARGPGASREAAKAAEKWALNPQGMMDRDQRKKNRDNAIALVTGQTGSASRQQHPELRKTMEEIRKKNTGQKRELDFEDELFARGPGASREAAKAAEKWALNPQGMMDRDQRKKNRDNAIALATGQTGSSSRQQHPELRKTMDEIRKNNAEAAKKMSGQKRELEYEDELFVRGPGASREAAKAAEKWALNPQGMMDRDQRKKNRDNAIALATGQTGSASRQQHPELRKTMEEIRKKNTGQKRELEYEDELFVRGPGASREAAKAAEKWALNPQGMMDRDQRKKNRDNAIALATGQTGSASRQQHPELRKTMDEIRKNNAEAAKKMSGQKREIALELVERWLEENGIEMEY